ncbi:thioredoxin family protein [Roseibium denhamense]|uniref:AhpC/TSA family protein n=1 Tax=Roseibium denhamense TaxID=76305 RepID=A0ABY1P8Z1_9HYPH|nr:thioredoxin family protein [Roseibium denhamense]MTI07353.1 thioredoxin family protein [Roseibium denhamense]SMP28999.1 AhpC/TSA family protein [Roseibium denhamense]
MPALDTPICDFGWKAPDFTLKDPQGRAVTLSETASGKKAVLIAFICNHCPYVKAIADRLADDARVLQEAGIAVIAVMSNDYRAYPADSPDNMTAFAKAHKFPFPYLIDEDQSVAKAYDAVCTPDFFGLNKDLELQYRGRLDDARMGDASNRTAELVNAMRQIAETGQGPTHQVPSMGCSIKWASA